MKSQTSILIVDQFRERIRDLSSENMLKSLGLSEIKGNINTDILEEKYREFNEQLDNFLKLLENYNIPDKETFDMEVLAYRKAVEQFYNEKKALNNEKEGYDLE